MKERQKRDLDFQAAIPLSGFEGDRQHGDIGKNSGIGNATRKNCTGDFASQKILHGQEKAAETHVKAAIGGAVLALLHESKCPAGFDAVILARADHGVQKQGLGREKFEALKARFRKTQTEK